MCVSTVCVYFVFPRSIHLSVRTAYHPSSVVKHCSLTSLIRQLLNHLSVCLTVCSLFSFLSVLFSCLRIFPFSSNVAPCFVTLHLFPHIKQVPCSPQTVSLPLCSLFSHPLVRGESEYNRVNHSHSEAVSLSIHSTAETWNTLLSSTYHHKANTYAGHGTQA